MRITFYQTDRGATSSIARSVPESVVLFENSEKLRKSYCCRERWNIFSVLWDYGDIFRILRIFFYTWKLYRDRYFLRILQIILIILPFGTKGIITLWQLHLCKGEKYTT